MKSNNGLDCAATTLAGIGALNWGLVGALGFDLVAWLAGLVSLPILANIVYILVGLAGAWVLWKKFM